jgi:hypothetical protein
MARLWSTVPLEEIVMNSKRKIGLVVIVVASGLFSTAPIALAQSTDAKSQQHMQGGTQPGPGTHGHSSAPQAGEEKEIQQQQHNMPATPSHSGGPATGKSNQ